MLRDLSYHYKIPLSLTLVIAMTGLVVSATLMWQAYDDARHQLVSNGLDLGKTLSRALTPALIHDDTWQAYEIITTPLDSRHIAGSADRVISVLDNRRSIYVSSAPDRFPILGRMGEAGAEFAALERRIARTTMREPFTADDPGWDFIHVVVPILAEDQTPLGTLVLSFSRDLFLPRFHDAFVRVLLSTSAVLLVLLPLGWYWGKRMAEPLEYLAESMTKVGREPFADLRAGLPKGRDEIGMLSARFGQMLGELEEKKAMEKQMLASERLAAIGRLTAGIGHEINNPLGGMLNAISTYKKHGTPDAMTFRTMSLLERGLLQIRETVAALLVEARLESHALTAQDIEDTRTLVTPDAEQKNARFIWNNEIVDPLPLPSTQVRQILLNLLLNAVEAVDPEGRLECSIARANGSLQMQITNEGRAIARDRLDHLYEPFAPNGEENYTSRGLGLWVTYQLVQQLRGHIEGKSEGSITTFTVSLPINA